MGCFGTYAVLYGLASRAVALPCCWWNTPSAELARSFSLKLYGDCLATDSLPEQKGILPLLLISPLFHTHLIIRRVRSTSSSASNALFCPNHFEQHSSHEQ